MINLFYTSGSNISGNKISQSYCALLFKESNNATITNNIISNTILATIFGTGSDNIFKTNIMDGIWGESVIIWEGANNTYEKNIISGAKEGFPAISLEGINPSAIGNTISNCHTGLRIRNESYVKGNDIQDCIIGIDLNSPGSIIKENTISVCDLGIQVIGSENNISENIVSGCSKGIIVDKNNQNNQIYYNDFLDNSINAVDEGYNNVWDNAVDKGNYWSNYFGTDSNGDRIGDTPYYIQPNGIDRYPQMTSNFPSKINEGSGSGNSGCFISIMKE
jgi:nitrous oxidase accessory protein NosD